MNLRAGEKPVSITERQASALGFKIDEKPAKIGCGRDACAYLNSHSDAVVKLTKDASDALACWSIKQQGAVPWAAPIYAVHRLKNAFAICMGKAEKLPPEWAKPIDAFYNLADIEDYESEEWDDVFKDWLTEIEWLEAEHGGATTSDHNMRRALMLIDGAVRALRALGFDWWDYHSDNWGMIGGRPVLIDLGTMEARNGLSIERKVKEIPPLPF